MLNVGPGRRDLLIALAGRLTSTFGDEVALVALTLRLQADGARPYEVALLLAAGTVPLLLLARYVGRLVDRQDSRRLLVAAGLAAVATTAPLVVLHSVAAIVILVAVLGASQLLSATTWSALIPRVVGEDHVAEAISAMQSLNALVMVAAPAVGGVLAAAFGTGVPLALDLATFIALTAAAALVRTRRRPEPMRPDGPAEQSHGGFTLLLRDQVLAPLTIGVALVVLLVGMVDVVLVFLVRDTLHASAAWYGAAQAAWMTGMVVGALGGGRLRTEAGRTWVTLGGVGVVCAALAPFAVAPSVWILMPLSILGGIANGYATVCFSTLLVTRTPEANRGRVNAAINAILGGAQGLSLLAGGALAVVLSPRAIYGVAGALGVMATIVIAARQFARSPGEGDRAAPFS
jgi:MFS family permease